MKFVDEVTVTANAGRGGDGCLSFLRRANYAKGGPDGGNGGAGGSVYLVGDPSLNTLVDLRFKPQLKAANGQQGSGSLKKGANGKSIDVLVPCGTTVIDDDTLMVLGDVTDPGQRLRVAAGGKPGRGNASFKSSTNRAPRITTQGERGETKQIRLQLRVLADVGLLGMPNAGKSTLLSAVSASRPKIADYPFTTLHPSLGVVRLGTDNSFVIADVPGLIAGASRGLGLGLRFLRHLTRTSILLHLVEVNPPDGSDPCANLESVENELAAYSETLANTPIYTVLTKTDTVSSSQVDTVVAALREIAPNRPTYAISSVTNAGVSELMGFLGERVREAKRSLADDSDYRLDVQSRRDRLALDTLDRSLEERRALKDKPTADADQVELIYRRD